LINLKLVTIENFRAIEKMQLPLHKQLTVFVGDNGTGKTSILDAISMVLGEIPKHFGVHNRRLFEENDILQDSTSVKVQLENTAGLSWYYESQKMRYNGLKNHDKLSDLHQYLNKIIDNLNESQTVEIPVLAYYGMNREALKIPKEAPLDIKFDRLEALKNALNVTPDFWEVFEWFFALENFEQREKIERHDWDYQITLLKTVRHAICRMIPNSSNPRTKVQPLRFVVDLEIEGAKKQILSLEQLSAGYRVMLSLVIDLARRMAQANPHLEEKAIESEAIVLIDEIDLHLHPKWQQRVLVDLMQTFPNTQFIVTTHSAAVLTTVTSENIVVLYYQNGKLTANSPSSNTYGAEAGRVLNEIMGVNQRPPAKFNEFTQLLEQYRDLIKRDEGEESDALNLRYKLNRLSGNDPELLKADLEIRRRRILKRRKNEKS
jgi:predicted ATP-binding protein involved in virulence